MSMPLSLRAQMGPNPRIIDDASWAKLMAAGLTLNAEDLKPYGSGRAREAGWKATYYPGRDGPRDDRRPAVRRLPRRRDPPPRTAVDSWRAGGAAT